MGLRIGLRMLGHDQGIEFAENGDGRTRTAAFEVGADTGPGEFVPDGKIQGREYTFNQCGCFEFIVAGFRVFPDLKTESDDFVLAAVDFTAEQLLERILVHGFLLFS